MGKIIPFPLINDNTLDWQYENYYSSENEEDYIDYDYDSYFDDQEEDLLTRIINGIKSKIIELLTRFCYWLE